MLYGLIFVAILGALGLLIVNQASIAIWTISYTLLALLFLQYGDPGAIGQFIVWSIFAVFLIGTIKPLRQSLLSKPLLQLFAKRMPSMSSTEREALEAGTIGWEGELFSGYPNFDHLLLQPAGRLSEEEHAFLNGPVNRLCRMINDWDITHNRADMPPEIWDFIKENGFLGMIIPKCYGGLEFSATAQMSVVVKLYGCSITVATSVAVPNSLGPAELLLKYGTDEQKEHYLPRLANGSEIPCFALTGPNAGSDAASIPDQGIVCKQSIDGVETLGVLLNWDKRYITLSPIATIIGLAFRLFDPDGLLGKGEDLGITLALIPANTPGITRGRRHFPLNSVFLNGPTQGKDVFIPMDCLIGGARMAGQGWRMLMECLSAGRAISLPSSASGGSQSAALGSGAYARVRKQFNQPIGKFEGIEEALARIGGKTYMIDSALSMTVAAIDRGEKSAVAGAILKYHTTEWGRQVAQDAMDIHGGKGICLGPNNYLGRGYEGAPISITVEGANILTRCLIIFGQGAIRCHPYVFREMESVRTNDVGAFDKALWGHVSHTLANLTRSLCFSLTDARFVDAPDSVVKRYYQLIKRYSSNLAFLADFCMIVMGASLKRKEKISARLGDMLSYLYVASGVLNRFYHDGEPEQDLPLVHWSCQFLFQACESAMGEVISNFPSRWGRVVLKMLLQPVGAIRSKPSDHLGHQVAKLMIQPNDTRTRLSRLAFCEPVEYCALGKLEQAFHQICAVETLEKLVTKAAREGQLKSLTLLDQIEEAQALGLLKQEEAKRLKSAELARQQVIAVDDFSTQELAHQSDRSGEGKKSKVEEVATAEA